MSFFLSLAKGDFEARNMLKEAVIARYATRPLPLEAAVLTLQRRERALLGLPLTVTVRAAYAEPDRWLWQETRRLFGIQLGNRSESPAEQTDPFLRESLLRQQWAFRALLLTPLTREGVSVRAVAERAFQAVHEAQPEAIATLYLKPDYTLAAVEVERYRPSDKRRLPYMLRPEGGYQSLDGVNLPVQISEQWGSEPSRLYRVTAIQLFYP
ncbi:MAG: hypothetical protein CUN51_06940 [Candidatus Thermofonsia Clade 1 bacterium]|uniref:Uncharacterized protein n=1 Tax=Candidatus Thermofonsia Clade 1 bacterium TaxID=2364210 RepID=A0A2M8NZL3_9CHLR|nr:MAG: hypothetical protein CUN51_06940 [Candidatus Thermofonsia Clade 1 bacterium]